MNDALQPAIDVKGLVKRYGKRTVVDQVDLKLMPGSICGFLGTIDVMARNFGEPRIFRRPLHWKAIKDPPPESPILVSLP